MPLIIGVVLLYCSAAEKRSLVVGGLELDRFYFMYVSNSKTTKQAEMTFSGHIEP